MPRVTLARAWNPGEEYYVPGDEVDVDDDVAAWLKRTGAVARHARNRSKEPDADAAAKVDDVPDEEPDADAAEKSEKSEKRPARTASLDTWKAFAEKQGIQTKGMSKQDIIAATA